MQKAWNEISPEDEIYWLIDENLKFLMAARTNVITIGPKTSFKGLVKQLKKIKFDISVCFHVPWWVALAVFMAGVKTRVGVASQWFSWILYNKKIRQKRSLSLKNEAYYNLDLVNFALGSQFSLLKPYELRAEQTLVESWRQKLGSGFVVVHPGMGGSARNWPLESYNSLVKELLQKWEKIVVTGGASDKNFVNSTNILSFKGVVDLVGQTSPEDLLAVLSLAKAIVAPSTGVAHIGASLGKKVLGIYSPVKVQAPIRWGPIGENVIVFKPEVNCPGVFKCLENKCAEFDCMKTIEVETVVRNI
ncbi:MAG: glycosyltransferase family 9 protein [Oligoflexia bacterium]|nr:glycosyltransferase family 9 protein [Oligoflexia bacterium]